MRTRAEEEIVRGARSAAAANLHMGWSAWSRSPDSGWVAAARCFVKDLSESR